MAEFRYRTGHNLIQPHKMTKLFLNGPYSESHRATIDGDLLFYGEPRWLEVLLTVKWAETEILNGTRFSHSKVPGSHPLHSEAINAQVLKELSDSTQLLRGNGLFGEGQIELMQLEVWHDDEFPIVISEASLTVRELN